VVVPGLVQLAGFKKEGSLAQYLAISVCGHGSRSVCWVSGNQSRSWWLWSPSHCEVSWAQRSQLGAKGTAAPLASSGAAARSVVGEAAQINRVLRPSAGWFKFCWYQLRLQQRLSCMWKGWEYRPVWVTGGDRSDLNVTVVAVMKLAETAFCQTFVLFINMSKMQLFLYLGQGVVCSWDRGKRIHDSSREEQV